MERTPNFLKSKFLSVLDSSNDLLNGITTKLDLSNQSSSSESNTNRKSGSNAADDVSLDENIIDFESRKVKEKRAQDEVATGKYRHPNFIAKTKANSAAKRKIYSMVEMNPESSISGSNSLETKTPDSMTPSVTKDDLPNASKESNATVSLAVCLPGTALENSISECDLQVPSISDYSIELTKMGHSNSNYSVQSLKSVTSLESHAEDDVTEFMHRFVDILFSDSSQLTQELKSEFGSKSQTESGRFWFARYVSAQRTRSKRVTETSFYSLIQHFAIILFECKENDDFAPAKVLMNMCFTYFYEVDVPGCEPYREYLYIYLRYQPIWHALRFWNAAYFDAVQCERNHRPVPQTYSITLPVSESSDDEHSLGSASASKKVTTKVETDADLLQEDADMQRNICFGQLGTFTCNMHAFGLTKELCDEFLRKQCVISNISNEQEKMLTNNLNRMFKETAKWRKE